MRLFKQGDTAGNILKIVMIIGAAVFAARLLIATNTFHSGLLYIAWPFSLSLALYYFTSSKEGISWKQRLWNNFRTSTIVLLASSLILMEGYVCVVMAMPIFFVGFLLAFIVCYFRNKPGKNSLSVQMIPLLVVLVSLEGVTEATTFERYNEVVYSQVVFASVETIKLRLATPPKPRGNRHWILSLFPMPKTIGNVGLKQGDVRIYEFVYHRWFTTNTHTGKISVTFDEVTESRIKTSIADTSYIANYLKLHGSELIFEPVDDHRTKLILKIGFERMIDPFWYFEPLERFAVKKAAKYFIGALLSRGPDVVVSNAIKGRS